jgi:hypothetical protein
MGKNAGPFLCETTPCKTIEGWSTSVTARKIRGKAAMTEAPNDQRVIREDYRNYDLIARYWDGCYRGRLFKLKERIADIEGEDLDAIVQELRKTVDQLVHERQKQRKKAGSVVSIAAAHQGITTANAADPRPC